MKKKTGFILSLAAAFLLGAGTIVSRSSLIHAQGTEKDKAVPFAQDPSDAQFKAERAAAAPDMNDISEATWGKPIVHVDRNTDNASLVNYEGQTAEDTWMDIYIRWDTENLYIGIVSEDKDVKGDAESYKGDGIQFKLAAGSTMTGDAKNIYFTLGANGTSVTSGDTGGGYSAKYPKTLTVKNNRLYAAIAIPQRDLGLAPSDVRNGTTYAFSILRISGTRENSYAGWLAWGAFFGSGVDNNPTSYTDNVITLYDPNALEETPGFESALVNLSRTTGMDENFIDNGHNIVTTGNAGYAVYVVRSGVLGSDVNEFSLQRMADGQSKEVGYGYTYHGSLDVAADARGDVYVIGGSSTWNMKYSLGKDIPEEAVLNIWKYTEGKANLDGYTVNIPFGEKTQAHEYLTSAIDTEKGKIYTVYYGKNTNDTGAVEYFVFDIATKTWENTSTVIKTSAVPQTVFAYPAQKGIELIYGNGKAIYRLADGKETRIADGELYDAYAAAQNEIRVLYAPAGAAKLSQLLLTEAGAQNAESTEIPVNHLGQMVLQEGVYYYIALDASDTATLYVYSSADGKRFTAPAEGKKLDEVVTLLSYPMLSRSDNGSTGDLLLLFAGERLITQNWYYTKVLTH